MKRNMTGFSRQYHAALRQHLKQDGRHADSSAATELGQEATTIGIGILDVARIHERALVTLVSPDDSPGPRDSMVRQAGRFFAEAITPIEKTHRTAQEGKAHLNQVIEVLSHRSLELIAANRRLTQETLRRKSAEQSLRKSEQHYGELLKQSRRMQEQLRLLSRQLLLAQEEERKRISRELHDIIGQTLTRINIHLATLKRDAATNAGGLEQNIARTQQLVEKSVSVVHRFARELRPTVLDDLGLIPALHTLLKGFHEETGIRVNLSAFAAVEQLNGDKRTVLYRVAQEALTNVARHAQASQVQMKIQKRDDAVVMKIKDNGKGFQVERALHSRKGKRLGLLGMRERLDMVGGTFTIRSTPGKGTEVLAQIPLTARTRRAARIGTSKTTGL